MKRILITGFLALFLAPATILAEDSQVESVRQEFENTFFEVAGVVGVGTGICDVTPKFREPCIKIMLLDEEAKAAFEEVFPKLPFYLDGVRVSGKVSGPIGAQPGFTVRN